MAGFPDLLTIEVDGTDLISSYKAMSAAAALVPRGPWARACACALHPPYSHSLSEDEKAYKTKHERDEEALRDPLVTFPMFLIEEGVIEAAELEKIVKEIDSEILEDTHRAMKAEPPDPATALLHLYSEKVDPTSPQFDAAAQPDGEPKRDDGVDLLNATLREGCAATSG